MPPTKEIGVQNSPASCSMAETETEDPAKKLCKKKSRQPPPATRHRGVLSLATSIPLYDFGNRVGEPTLLTLINESIDAEPLFNVASISTGDQQVYSTEVDLVEITIRFYGIKTTGPNISPSSAQMKEIKSVMPKVWTPRMYLGAVNISIERNKAILIEAINFRGKRYISINDVHWLFNELNLNNPQLVAERLILKAAYYNVVGGELNNW